MEIYSTYSVKIKHFNNIFKQTVSIYRDAVDFLIAVYLEEWDTLSLLDGRTRNNYAECLVHATKANPDAKYKNFDKKFYKIPCYLRRAAISEAMGKVSSYRSNLKNWEAENPNTRGRKPSVPKAGFVYPCMYRVDMYKQISDYEAKLKVYVRNTWDWITVKLRKSDVDYIKRHCSNRKECAPTLQKRGKEWFLDFPFKENVRLNDTPIEQRTVVSVDLGINTAATISVMRADGTILGRHFCKLPKEIAYDGSGAVLRGRHGGFSTYELCRFKNGKTYNCDLSASYNIGARYFIRELTKSLDESSRLLIEAKVPQCIKRSTCTLSTLISLNAELMSLAA